MLKLKGCPKCKKDAVTLDRDQYGWYAYCLLCGYMRDLTGIVESGQQRACNRAERGERARALSKGKYSEMVNRVYILLDIVDGKAEHVTQVLRESPGVVTVDVLEGPPDIIITMEAAERQQLTKLTIQALAVVETMTKDVRVLPAKPGLNGSFLTSLSSQINKGE